MFQTKTVGPKDMNDLVQVWLVIMLGKLKLNQNERSKFILPR